MELAIHEVGGAHRGVDVRPVGRGEQIGRMFHPPHLPIHHLRHVYFAHHLRQPLGGVAFLHHLCKVVGSINERFFGRCL